MLLYFTLDIFLDIFLDIYKRTLVKPCEAINPVDARFRSPAVWLPIATLCL